MIHQSAGELLREGKNRFSKREVIFIHGADARMPAFESEVPAEGKHQLLSHFFVLILQLKGKNMEIEHSFLPGRSYVRQVK